MKTYIREIYDKDIERANEWLKAWGLNPLDERMYPTTGLALCEEDTHEVLYVGFVWCSNSQMAMIGFVTRNFNYKKKLPKQTRKIFMNDLTYYASGLGYHFVITWTDNQFLVGDFKKLGYTETSNKVSELILKIE